MIDRFTERKASCSASNSSLPTGAELDRTLAEARDLEAKLQASLCRVRRSIRKLEAGRVSAARESEPPKSKTPLSHRILRLLHEGPSTAREIAIALKIPQRQVTRSLYFMRHRQKSIDIDGYSPVELVEGPPAPIWKPLRKIGGQAK